MPVAGIVTFSTLSRVTSNASLVAVSSLEAIISFSTLSRVTSNASESNNAPHRSGTVFQYPLAGHLECKILRPRDGAVDVVELSVPSRGSPRMQGNAATTLTTANLPFSTLSRVTSNARYLLRLGSVWLALSFSTLSRVTSNASAAFGIDAMFDETSFSTLSRVTSNASHHRRRLEQSRLIFQYPLAGHLECKR